MALLEVPTNNSLPAYEMTVTLDGTNYIVALYFNPRLADGAGKWMISLSDQNRNLLIGPVPVVANWTLFDRFFADNPPKGTLFAFDTSGQDLDPGQFDLGDRVRLFYLEAGTT